jgi:hypothetical protein
VLNFVKSETHPLPGTRTRLPGKLCTTLKFTVRIKYLFSVSLALRSVFEDQRAGMLDRYHDVVIPSPVMAATDPGAAKGYTRSDIRFPLAVREDQRLALDRAKVRDNVTRNMRIRTMIDLWMADPEFGELVDTIAASEDARLWLQQNKKVSARRWLQKSA